MASYKCPRCGESYDPSLPECPVCGFETGAYTVETFFGREPEKKVSSGHAKKKSRARRALPVLMCLVLAICAVGFILFLTFFKPLDSYNFASSLMVKGEYERAGAIFNSLANFRDSREMADICEERLSLQAEEAAQIKALEDAYAEAEALLEGGEYEEAIQVFTELGDYSDSAARLKECELKIRERTYNGALELMENGLLDEALQAFADSRGYGEAEKYCTALTEVLEKSDELAGLKTGDKFTFGSLEQDNNADNGAEAIEWYVLENDGSRVTAISRNVLLSKAYAPAGDSDWESSSLRAWLNSDFIDGTFSEGERRLLTETQVIPDPNPRFALVNQGKAAGDRVWMLSYDEYEKLYQRSSGMMTAGVYTSAQGEGVYWWLRTMGSAKTRACFVNNRGGADVGGREVENVLGVRPVICLTIY